MMKLGWKQPTDRILRRPHISESCWQLDQEGEINRYDMWIALRTRGAWRNSLNRKANKLNKMDYWEAD